MSIVTYNGVVIPYAFTTQFRQRAIRDDLGDTDWYCTEFDIVCQGVLNTSYLPVIAPDLVGVTTNPAEVMNVIRTRLLQHKRRLSLVFNGKELIPQAILGNTGMVDAENGPKPQSCDIVSLTDTTFLFTYHIIARYWENNQTSPGTGGVVLPIQNLPGNDVLYNRWTETVEIDDLQMTTRIREGKFMIRSDNPDGRTADQVRSQMAVVGVPKGFRRESAHYTQDPSGLRIMYRITDKEVFLEPPYPASKAEGEYYESTTDKGYRRWGQVRVKLQAAKNIDQAKLLEKCIAVASSKLVINGADLTQTQGGSAFSWLEHSAIKVNMYENEVECTMKCLMKPRTSKSGKGRKKGVWGLRFGNMTFTPFSDRFNANPPARNDRGTASFLLQAAAYYDPSLQGTVMDPLTGQMTAGFAPGTAGLANDANGGTTGTGPHTDDNPTTPIQDVPGAFISISNIPIDDNAAKYIDLSDDIAIFTDYMVHNHYEKDGHTYMMGVAASSPQLLPTGFPSVAFVQLGMPTLLWIADWTAAKLKTEPQIPDPRNPDPNWVLLDDWYEPVMVTVGSDGVTPLYRISGTYVYGHTGPDPLTIKNIIFPRPPWLDDSSDIPRAFDPGLLQQNIVNAVG